MRQGVTFGEKHSFRDWGLYIRELPIIDPPNPKTVFVDLPGADGQMDLTESLTGDVTYQNRTITCKFYTTRSFAEWPSIYSEIQDYLHGRRMKFIDDNDPNYYYQGRFQVNEWAPGYAASTIVISGTVDPYKYEIASSLEDWKWDPFCFEDGVIREYADLQVEGTYTLSISGSRKPVVPTFIVDSDDGSGLQVKFKGTTYSLTDGSSRAPDLVIREGEHELTFSGSGTVSVDYRGGRL